MWNQGRWARFAPPTPAPNLASMYVTRLLAPSLGMLVPSRARLQVRVVGSPVLGEEPVAVVVQRVLGT